MFRSLLCKIGVPLKWRTTITNGKSSSSTPPTAKYLLHFTTIQNRNVVISNSRVTSTFFSFSTTASNLTSSFDSLCGLSPTPKKLNFKTKSNHDSVPILLRSYGFTEYHISKLILRYPAILSCNPHENIKPKLDFFKSKGLYGLELANFISMYPGILRYSLNKYIIATFDILKRAVHTDENVIKMIKRNCWVPSTNKVKLVMVNLELLRSEGVPETYISKYLIHHPRAYAEKANRFKEIVEKVKEMGFNRVRGTFLKAVLVLISLSEASWREKMDVYKRWGWTEDHIQTAFRKNPQCMMASEKKIMAVMNFLVNEMGYESLSIAECPLVITCSLKERIIPRYSVIRILVSRGLIKEKIPMNTLSTVVDKSFLEKFVIKYEQQVPGLMKVFQGFMNFDCETKGCILWGGCALSNAYDSGRFCDMFHSSAAGWRNCESCGKRLHCGCVVSTQSFVLLDAGGVDCISMRCARKNAMMAARGEEFNWLQKPKA